MILKELKEDVEKVKETKYEQNGNSNKEIESLRRNKSSGAENKITEMKTSPQGFEGNLRHIKERIRDLEDKTIEIIQAEKEKFY